MNDARPESKKLRSIGVEEFVRRLRETVKADKRFALFLGAGCSVTSGIPAAGDLVKGRCSDGQSPATLDDWPAWKDAG